MIDTIKIASSFNGLTLDLDSNSNIIVGDSSAGSKLTTGQYNFAIGQSALAAEQAGNFQVAIGPFALQSHDNPTSADAYNIAVGFGALSGLITGGQNIAIGSYSLSSASGSAGRNIGIGYQVGTNFSNALTGTKNILIGSFGASAITTGSFNIIFGDEAGATLTTGSHNIVIGQGQDVNSGTTDSQLNIGGWIYGLAGDIGIGVVTPTAKLDVNGTTNSTAFSVGGTSGASFTGAITNLTVVNGIVTAAS